MLLTQPLRRMNQIAATRIATIDGSEQRTWAETHDRIAKLARGLADLGVKEGDRVAILALNSFRYMETYFGILWRGAVVVPLNTRWSVEELGYGLSDSASDVLFIDANFLPHLPTLRERWPNLKHVVFIGENPPPGLLAYESLISDKAALPPADLPPTALAVICYTGGTTGLAKGVMQSHLAIWASSVALSIDYDTLTSERTAFLHAMPLFHAGGSAVLFATTILSLIHI